MKPTSHPLPQRGHWALGVALLVALLATTSCAKQGYPSGGPKDEQMPVTMGCKPQNESRHFNSRQFYIEFDEYVVLKDADNNVLVSPPMKQKPTFSTKGKGIAVKLNDTLLANTTYLFQFKDAIADFTEGNLLPSFEYVFSTGDAMDTMMLAGRVLQARNGKPATDVITVMAYRDERFAVDSADTIATWGQPDFVTRCDKEGYFSFHYIPHGNYRLVALADKNRDLRAAPTEAIAWDTTPQPATDSIDSTAIANLLISTPVQRTQRLMKAEFASRGHIVVTTALPMQTPSLAGDSLIIRLNERRDTLHAWMLDPSRDSVRVVLTDAGLNDTIKLRYRPNAGQRGRGRNKNAQQTNEPLMRSLCTGGSAFYDELWIAFSNPVESVSDSVFATITRSKDSTETQAPLALDSTGLRARIEANIRSGELYHIYLSDSLFRDIYGTYTDSLSFNMTPRDYGVLNVIIDNLSGHPLLIEVLDSKDTVVASLPLVEVHGNLRFDHLKGAEYRLRAVIDQDTSRSWTPADYRLGRQPERCIMYEKTLQLRDKWEMEERWTVGTKKPRISAASRRPAKLTIEP